MYTRNPPKKPKKNKKRKKKKTITARCDVTVAAVRACIVASCAFRPTALVPVDSQAAAVPMSELPQSNNAVPVLDGGYKMPHSAGSQQTNYASPAAVSGCDGYASEPTSVPGPTIHVERSRAEGSQNPMQHDAATHTRGDVTEYHLAQEGEQRRGCAHIIGSDGGKLVLGGGDLGEGGSNSEDEDYDL